MHFFVQVYDLECLKLQIVLLHVDRLTANPHLLNLFPKVPRNFNRQLILFLSCGNLSSFYKPDLKFICIMIAKKSLFSLSQKKVWELGVISRKKGPPPNVFRAFSLCTSLIGVSGQNFRLKCTKKGLNILKNFASKFSLFENGTKTCNWLS